MNKPTIDDVSRLLSSMRLIGFTSEDVEKISSPEFLLDTLLISRGFKRVSDEIIIPDENSLFQPITVNLDSFRFVPGKEINDDANSLDEIKVCIKKQYPTLSLLGAKEGDSIFFLHQPLMSLWKWTIEDEDNLTVPVRYLFADTEKLQGVVKKEGRYLLKDIPFEEIRGTDFFVCYEHQKG